jgi:CheY-like chemotaxis protein
MLIVLIDRAGHQRAATASWLQMLRGVVAVEVVDSGAAALARLGDGRPLPQLVLVDSQIADMDPFELVRRIKSHPSAPRVVMIARVLSDRVLAAARAAGADHGIEKSRLHKELPSLLPLG